MRQYNERARSIEDQIKAQEDLGRTIDELQGQSREDQRDPTILTALLQRYDPQFQSNENQLRALSVAMGWRTNISSFPSRLVRGSESHYDIEELREDGSVDRNPIQLYYTTDEGIDVQMDL